MFLPGPKKENEAASKTTVSADSPIIEIIEEELIVEIIAASGQVIAHAFGDTSLTSEIVVTDNEFIIVTVEADVATQVTIRLEREELMYKVEVPTLLDLETNVVRSDEDQTVFIKPKDSPNLVADFVYCSGDLGDPYRRTGMRVKSWMV